MWERRAYSDSGEPSLCTAKFKGRIEPWGDNIAIGVEWDDPSRGRNSGSLDGTEYFTVVVPGSGSFVKATRVPLPSVSFGTAFASKYLENPNLPAIQLSQVKKVETFDVEEMHARQSDVHSVAAVSLANSLIDSMDCKIDFTKFFGLQRLDLGFNLLPNFAKVTEACAAFPSLKTLRLDGNRFQWDYPSLKLEVLEELSLQNTLVPSNIELLPATFPNLRVLGLANNSLTKLPALPPNLKTLDIAGNKLTPTPIQVDVLYASNCKVSTLSAWAHIPTLDIRGNPACLDWDELSKLHTRDLHLQTSPTNRPFVIARCANLIKLDGTPVTLTERSDAELYILNCIVQRKHPTLPAERWDALVAKFGVPAPPPNGSICARALTYYVNDREEPLQIVCDAPVGRLRRQISRALLVSPQKLEIRGISEEGLLQVRDVLADGDRLECISLV